MLLFMRSLRFCWAVVVDGGTALGAVEGLNGCLGTADKGGRPAGASRMGAAEATGAGASIAVCCTAGLDAGVFLGGNSERLLGVDVEISSEASTGAGGGCLASGFGASSTFVLFAFNSGVTDCGGFTFKVASLISILEVLVVRDEALEVSG